MIATNNTEYFVEIVNTIEDYLRTIDDNSLYLFTRKDVTESTSQVITQRYPELVLRLLDRFVSREPGTYHIYLKDVLELIVKAAPGLKPSLSWRRLHKLATNQLIR